MNLSASAQPADSKATSQSAHRTDEHNRHRNFTPRCLRFEEPCLYVVSASHVTSTAGSKGAGRGALDSLLDVSLGSRLVLPPLGLQAGAEGAQQRLRALPQLVRRRQPHRR